jgi:hypothetical protein
MTYNPNGSIGYPCAIVFQSVGRIRSPLYSVAP